MSGDLFNGIAGAVGVVLMICEAIVRIGLE